ncbi:UvrD-helicase domain-containing protein [Natranaeroarchaeum sulfidigenes]|uniref:DNA 3'-5' helicase n=1 Tax=Natranaeroarchaeum sulfidigenes TaxID=2784880 RepID=A0A897MR40_9EURY|nr:ATP-dependent DNA helicase [Natranaeroarchaeum sulfidigenes]QSG02997.1 ATP-dependent exoDNAse (exonuclease V) beta subunit (contains helicase and exonuclease domains) [Natranaeroarchaeum sulfidigenes]
MSEFAPNPGQRELIDSTEGTYLVDAGAGTGKTFSITRRYAGIVDGEGVEPDDVLLVTFTNNAAAEMRERIVDRSAYGTRELKDAPIQTFHSLCHDLLLEHGHDAPELLGIDDHITDSTRLLDDEFVERSRFGEFVDCFSDDRPEYDDVFAALSEPRDLLDLLHELAAKGVFPTATGWYRDGERHLDGDFAAFKDIFDERNEPRNGGNKQSALRSVLYSYGDSGTYLPDAPSKSEIRGEGKQVPDVLANHAFHEDRERLKSFVHDVYWGYLRFSLRRNYLNFGFLQLLAYVLLCENHALRERIAFEYVMIDEFQDTSEIQFKLGLLCAGTENFCVVGDWKQSIYGFQYADVENIVAFEDRLERFAAELNRDHDRVGFEQPDVETISLVENYRSTDVILDLAEDGLVAPATSTEDVDAESILEDVTSLDAVSDYDHSRIEAFQSEDEQEALLSRIHDIVGDERFPVEGEDGELRAPEYGDMAVLTRRREFGRELLAAATENGLPMAYEGGVEIYRTDPAKLLLAWLRVLEYDADRGWAPLLERVGYSLPEIDAMLSSGTYPQNLVGFADELRDRETVGAIARHVFERYGYDGPVADAILHAVQSVHDATTMSRGDLLRYIERGIETGTTREVHVGAGTDAVTVQTIHATKGLEHPIVILADMNQHSFPPSGGGTSDITFGDPVGLRQRTVFDAEAYDRPHVFRNWRSDVLNRTLPRDYDEERRLLYVAITRAEHHVLFSAGETPSSFLESLPVEVEEIDPELSDVSAASGEKPGFTPDVRGRDGPAAETPHTIMRDDVFEGVDDGRGVEFGSRVHEFAEAYALGESVTPRNDDERAVAAFLDDLDGTLVVEEDVHLPLRIDGETITITGVVDLVHVADDRVDVIDYKTDRGRHAEDEYRKQLNVYHHVLEASYPDREVTTSIFYTDGGERVPVEPLSETELEGVVSAARER